MQTRSIGSLTVSVVGIGCNNFGGRLDEARSAAVVHAAIDAGITFFDTADVYGDTTSEVILGSALGSRRDEVVVATKFGMPTVGGEGGAAPSYVAAACEASLSRLRTDRIDLFQLHVPDPAVPIAETLGALTALRDAGKVVEIGCSNFTAAQLDEATGTPEGFRSVQNQLSLLYRAPETDGVLDACARNGVAFLPYYPLANGLLTGKVVGGTPPAGSRLAKAPAERQRYWLSDELLTKAEAVRAIAERRSTSMLSLAFSWLLAHGAVASVIAGASTPEQVRANAAAPADLDDALRAELDAATA